MLPKHLYRKFIRRAKQRGLSVELSYAQFNRLRHGQCFYCGVEPHVLRLFCEKIGVRTPYITIDRKDNALPYTEDNCVSCCFLCNKIKGNIFSAQEMREIAQNYLVPKMAVFHDEVWDEFTQNIIDECLD